MYGLVQIREDFFCAVFSGNSWPTASNVYIVRDPDGLTLIDAGTDNPACFDALSSCLGKIGRRMEDIHTILLTHGHPDHIGGLNAVLQRCSPHILIPEDCIPEAVDPKRQDYYCLPPQTRTIAPAMKDFDILENFNRTCGSWLIEPTRLTPLHHGESIKAGSYTFRAIQTPGHDIGLMCFYEHSRRMLMTGDLLRSSGPGGALPWYTSTAGGVEAYLASLEIIGKLRVKTTLPAHGPMTGVFDEMIKTTKEVISKRETDILALLNTGSKTCEQLDAHLYRPVVLKICPWFSTVTEAHLSKLEKAGVVRRHNLEYCLA